MKFEVPLMTCLALMFAIASCKKDNTDDSVEAGGPASAPVSDIDGNTYSTIFIGNQCWMAENLRTSRYRDGGNIPNISDSAAWSQLSTDAWCNFYNNPVNDPIYGKLYNGYAATNPNICPFGWHLPNETEWTQLEIALGMPSEHLNMPHSRGSEVNIGGRMKATTLWPVSSSHIANNESGFTGLPGASRNVDGAFGPAYSLIAAAYWWSATEVDSVTLWYHALYNNSDGVDREPHGRKTRGQYVRCVCD